jgi:hypothetical protein
MSKIIYHLTIEHIFYLQQDICYLTLKADGLYTSENVIEIGNVCEYETIGRKKFIFNNIDDSSNIQNRIFNVAKKLKMNYPQIFNEDLTKNNFSDIMDRYIKYYQKIDTEVIPKFYLRIKKENFIDIIKILENFYPETGFPNDGWVLVPKNEKFIAKLKPVNHLTIDLKYKNGKFYANYWNEIIVNNSRRLRNNSIYRCYWEDNKWIPKEERPEKNKPNNINVVEVVSNYLLKGFNLKYLDESKMLNYYDHCKTENTKKEYIDFFSFMKDFTKEWIISTRIDFGNSKLLDVGSGKSASFNMLSEIGFKYIIGIDSDPICILKSTIKSRTNNYIWMDINNNWNITDNVSQYGPLWDTSQLYKMKHLYNKFDLILFNFSIFYCRFENYETLISNINNCSKKGTYLLYNYIDYDISTDVLKEEFGIKQNNNYISINLPWKSCTHQEPKFNNILFKQQLLNNNWKLVDSRRITEYFKDYIDWQKLFVYQIWEKI